MCSTSRRAQVWRHLESPPAWERRRSFVWITAACLLIATICPETVASEKTYRGLFGWDNFRAWSPFGVPRDGDVAIVGADKDVSLSRNSSSLGEVRLLGNGRVATDGSRLLVGHGRGIVDISGPGATLDVGQHATRRSSNSLEAFELRIGRDGVLNLSGGNVGLDTGGDDANGGGRLINNEGRVNGGGVITIEGNGTVLESRGGSFTASRRDLKLRSTTGEFSFDNASSLRAVDRHSTLFVHAPMANEFNGFIRAGGGNEINFSEPLTVGSDAVVNLLDTSDTLARLFTPEFDNRGGSVNLSPGIISAGRVFQRPGSSLVVEQVFENGVPEPASQIIATSIDLSGTSRIDLDLILDGNTIVRDDAVIGGLGSLTFQSGHTYQARSDAGMTFDVPVINRGILSPGIPTFDDDGTAMIDFDALTLGTSSVLELTISGRELTQFDRIVTGDLSISGVLDVSVDDDFLPVVGERFHIMDAEARRGTFDVFNGSHFSTGRFEIVYEGDDVFLEVLPPIVIDFSRGDFNSDRVLDASDIDALTAATRRFANGDKTATDMVLDLTNDQVLDQSDRDVWVQDVSNTYFGDANLDGEFNSADFVQVFQRGQYEDDLVGNSGWADGDWNGDGEFDTGDFVLAFQSGGYEMGPRSPNGANVAAVPEPSTFTLSMFSLLCFFGFGRGKVA